MRVSDYIIDNVCHMTEVPRAVVESKSRKDAHVFARSVCARIMRDKLGWTQEKIGIVLGGRHPSSITGALKRLDGIIETDAPTTDWVNKIYDHIMSGLDELPPEVVYYSRGDAIKAAYRTYKRLRKYA